LEKVIQIEDLVCQCDRFPSSSIRFKITIFQTYFLVFGLLYWTCRTDFPDLIRAK